MAVREDVMGMLRADHAQVKELFAAYEAAADWATRWRIAAQACTTLEIHAELEARVFYPACDLHATQRGRGVVDESIQDHGLIAALIEQMRDMAPDNPLCHATFQELMDLVEGHMAQEEAAMFPIAEAARLDQDEALWLAMRDLKRQLVLPES